MKLNEMVSARYGCRFPARYNKPAIEYYRQHSYSTRCLFIFDMMNERNDYTLCNDDIRYMCEDATEVWAELFEAYLYAAYEDTKMYGGKPKTLIIILDDDHND